MGHLPPLQACSSAGKETLGPRVGLRFVSRMPSAVSTPAARSSPSGPKFAHLLVFGWLGFLSCCVFWGSFSPIPRRATPSSPIPCLTLLPAGSSSSKSPTTLLRSPHFSSSSPPASFLKPSLQTLQNSRRGWTAQWTL